jgi:hypothetical protein
LTLTVFATVIYGDVSMDAKDMLYFPKMVANIVAQLVYYTLTEVETFLIVITAICFGCITSWQWGLFLFLATQSVTRLVAGYVSLLAARLHMIARATSSVRSKEDS